MAENLDPHSFAEGEAKDRATNFNHGIQTPIRVISTASSMNNESSAFNFGADHGGAGFKQPASVDHGSYSQGSYEFNWQPPADPGAHNNNNNNDEIIKQMSGEISYFTALVLESKNSTEFHAKRHRNEKLFRHLGNGCQFNVNAKALTCLDEAILAFRNENYQACEAALVAARDILELRNHNILIADASEFG
jgi:hypothetical protein